MECKVCAIQSIYCLIKYKRCKWVQTNLLLSQFVPENPGQQSLTVEYTVFISILYSGTYINLNVHSKNQSPYGNNKSLKCWSIDPILSGSRGTNLFRRNLSAKWSYLSTPTNEFRPTSASYYLKSRTASLQKDAWQTRFIVFSVNTK
jgi:hypothetical protein